MGCGVMFDDDCFACGVVVTVVLMMDNGESSQRCQRQK